MTMFNSKLKVYIMLSGGVDSSVAAANLKNKGYDLVAVFMKCWSMDQINRMKLSEDLYDCSWEDDVQDASLVAKKLDIPFEVWDFQEQYYQKVVKYMIEEYELGRTPNPDVMCNGNIKFGIFYEQAMSCGADFVATGHYAAIHDKDITF
jgi:tRNA-uridine 2-sulfurtransferase